MYTPKISEELVPVLYRLAKDRRMPMTRLVDWIIRQSLASSNLPQVKPVSGVPVGNATEAGPRSAVAA